MRKILLLVIGVFALIGCSESEDTINVTPLNKVNDISLDYNASSPTVTLSRNIENCKCYVKGNSFWISNIVIKGDKISFDVIENIYFQKGYRSDSIIITEKDTKVGAIAVFQARNPYSPTKLAWCTTDATYKNLNVGDNLLTSKQVTEFICNLAKTTNGKDSYKNYPAFAYCIEMNHDLNNIEWYLPSGDDMFKILTSKGFDFFQFKNFWALNNSDYRAVLCRFSDNKQQCINSNDSKITEQYVFACNK